MAALFVPSGRIELTITTDCANKEFIQKLRGMFCNQELIDFLNRKLNVLRRKEKSLERKEVRGKFISGKSVRRRDTSVCCRE